jgi:methanogenic corrinoid protein MtbC1
MTTDLLVERLFEALTSGDRQAARALVNEQLGSGIEPAAVVTNLYWPTYDLVDRLYRQDQLTILSYNLATRLLRQIIDQTSSLVLRKARQNGRADLGRTVLAFCGPSESCELGAQMAVDLLEAAGFSVRFGGSAVPADEIQAAVQSDKPDHLVMFCSAPQDLPDIRALIDNIKEVGASAATQIVVGGGVFNRADGLAEEIGADAWAASPLELVETLIHDHALRATTEQRTVGKGRVAPAPRKANPANTARAA